MVQGLEPSIYKADTELKPSIYKTDTELKPDPRSDIAPSTTLDHNTNLEKQKSPDVESIRPESALSTPDQQPSPNTEPESLTQTQTNTPPYSTFSKRQKQLIVLFAAFGGFFSPLSASIYIPALTTLQKDYGVSSTLMNLTLTSYMIFQGLAPTIFGGLGDGAGRRPAYIIGFVIYIGANIGLALQNSYAALLILRCLQSTGSSGTIALGNGIVADIATSSERGVYMGYVTSGPMIAPAIAPVIGGILSEYLGWTSIFWFLVILASVYLILFVIAFPETARNVVGNGSISPRGWNKSLLDYLSARKPNSSLSNDAEDMPKRQPLRFPNPLATLKVLSQKDIALLLFYNSLIYTAFYDVLASAPYLFSEIYGFNDLQIGICFIPFGVGAFLAPMTAGRLMDWNYHRTARNIGMVIDKKRGDDLKDFPLERVRLTVAAPFVTLGLVAILCYGWVLEVETSLAAPLVLHFLIGLFLTSAFNCMSVMVIDYYPLSPSTATAANNLVRCLMGAAGTAVISMMIESMGRGWCFTFIAAVNVLFSPVLWVLLKWGPGWREERRVRGLEGEREKETEREEIDKGGHV